MTSLPVPRHCFLLRACWTATRLLLSVCTSSDRPTVRACARSHMCLCRYPIFNRNVHEVLMCSTNFDVTPAANTITGVSGCTPFVAVLEEEILYIIVVVLEAVVFLFVCLCMW